MRGAKGKPKVGVTLRTTLTVGSKSYIKLSMRGQKASPKSG